MIHHLSIGVREPERVARVLAELWNGFAMPFPVCEGGWIAMKGDASGTAIELTPLELDMVPGVGQPDPSAPIGYALQPWEVHYAKNPRPPAHNSTHVALSSVLDEAAVLAIARREGWRGVRCDRGPAFPVVELWIENRFLIEVLPPAMAQRYSGFMTPEGLAQLFGFPPPVRATRPQLA